MFTILKKIQARRAQKARKSIFLFSAISGLVGGTIAFFTANKSGSDNRKQFANTAKKLGTQINERAHTTGAQIQDVANKVKDNVTDAANKIKDKVEHMADKAGDKADQVADKAGDKANETGKAIQNKIDEVRAEAKKEDK